MIPLALLVPLLQSPAPPQGAPQAFQCVVALSLDRNLEDRWYHTAGSEGVRVSSAGTVVRGQVFCVYPFFLGSAPDKAGRARVEYDLRILRPDGEAYFEDHDLPGYDGAVGDPTAVRLARALVAISFDPEDAEGLYTVEVTAKDLVAGVQATASRTMQLVEYEEGPAFESDEDLQAWHTRYFDAPRPDRAIPALRAFAAHGWDSEEPTDPRGFLREVFDGNHWLFEELFARFGDLDAESRRAALWLLARSSCEPDALVAKLEGPDREVWKATLAARRDPMEEPISGRLDVNELWGMYLASRRYAVLERLCWSLAADETGVVEKTTLRPSGMEVDVPLGMVVSMTVGDLLETMAKRDPVTLHYLQWLAGQDSTPKGVRARLAEILAE